MQRKCYKINKITKKRTKFIVDCIRQEVVKGGEKMRNCALFFYFTRNFCGLKTSLSLSLPFLIVDYLCDLKLHHRSIGKAASGDHVLEFILQHCRGTYIFVEKIAQECVFCVTTLDIELLNHY